MFLAWTGSWSSHSGFGAFFFCCLWLLTLGLGLFSAFIAPSFLTVIISAQILKQAKAFGRLSVEISRHFAMRLGLLAMSGGTGKIKGNKSTGDKILSSIRNRISEHRDELKFLWRESRYFTLSLGVTVVLVILILILI